MTQLAIINNITKICENVSTDTRSANEINIQGYTVLNLDNISVITWIWNKQLKDFEQFESIGNGGIGFIYTDGKLVQVKPEKPVNSEQTLSLDIVEDTI
jgi:hypothetical protein